MEFRNIFIANPAKLSIKDKQLVIEQSEKVSVPIEDISCVLIETPQINITSAALCELSSAGVNVFFCDEKHLPCGTLLPMNCHSRQLKILKSQLSLSKPVEKQIWKDIVKQKILNQASCLELSGKDGSEILRNMADTVNSGDTGNVEAKAAAFYFPALFGKGFFRGSDEVNNSALNYGYAILRGAIARNLVVYGMEPCLGIHHHSELNQFNLSDDIIEPFRPIVDLLVSRLGLQTDDVLNQRIKHSLFNLTNLITLQNSKRYRVISAIEQCVISLSQSFVADGNRLQLPTLLPLEEHSYA